MARPPVVDETRNLYSHQVIGNKNDTGAGTSIVSALTRIEGSSRGTTWYADSNVTASGDGKDWTNAWKTIAEAVTAASAGDTILMFGSFNEAVTCAKASITFQGAGNNPKDCQWTAPTVAASFCLTPTANYIRTDNIYFRPVVYTTSGVPSAIRLNGSNWFHCTNCRFQGRGGSYAAIYSPVCNSDNVHILNCEFWYMNTATNGICISGVEAGGLSYSGWVIERCEFMSSLQGIDINGRACVIRDCMFSEYGINPAGAVAQLMTTGIDLSGTSSGGNMVYGNWFPGDYSTARYVAGASGDSWVGNYADDVAETEVGDNAITLTEPAA